jgi:hypothetical protein
VVGYGRWMSRSCPAFLNMYDGEYEGECELVEGHAGAHWDGLTTWRTDDDGWTDYATIDLAEDLAVAGETVFLLFGENEHTEDEPDIVVFASRDSAERYASQHYTGWNVEEYQVHP